jgi:hypothetical protein
MLLAGGIVKSQTISRVKRHLPIAHNKNRVFADPVFPAVFNVC